MLLPLIAFGNPAPLPKVNAELRTKSIIPVGETMLIITITKIINAADIVVESFLIRLEFFVPLTICRPDDLFNSAALLLEYTTRFSGFDLFKYLFFFFSFLRSALASFADLTLISPSISLNGVIL